MQPQFQRFQLSDEFINYNVVTTDTNYTAAAADDVILCTNTITITLPDITTISSGFFLHVKNNGTGTVTIVPYNNEMIDGSTQVEITIQYNSFYFVTDGTNWFMI